MSYIKSYHNYAKKQSSEVKNIHSVLIASILTGIFIVVYLYLVRGITPPTPEINPEKVYENKINDNSSLDLNTNSNILDLIQNNNLKNISKKEETLKIESNNLNPFQTVKDIFSKAAQDISEIKNSLGESEYKVGQ